MKLGLGTVQLGMVYGVANCTGKPDFSVAQTILSEAWQSGIDAFDTASAYGDSEKIIGDFVSNHRLQGKIKISTKTAGQTQRDNVGVEATLVKAAEDALMILSVPQIDYFLLHDPLDQRNYDVLRALQTIKAGGLARKTGVSVYTPEDVGYCMGLRHPPDVVQIPFNILDRRLLDNGMLVGMRSMGIEVHARSIYLQGLITMGPENLPEFLRSAQPFIMELEEIASDCGLTRKELAHCYVRDTVYVDRMFIGCETLEQLRSNLRIHTMPPVDYERVQAATRKFAYISENILNPALWRR